MMTLQLFLDHPWSSPDGYPQLALDMAKPLDMSLAECLSAQRTAIGLRRPQPQALQVAQIIWLQ
jgi:hypothetical protein